MNQAKGTGPLGNTQNLKIIHYTKKRARATIAEIFGQKINKFFSPQNINQNPKANEKPNNKHHGNAPII